MQKTLIKFSSLFMLLIMSFMLCSFTVSAAPREESTTKSTVKNNLSVKGVSSKSVSSYTALSLYINGRKAAYSARLINGEVYIPIRKMAESLTGATVRYNSQSKTLTVTGNGHNISVSDGAYVLYASDRPLFFMSPSVVLSDGAMYTPAPTLAKAFGMSFAYSGSSRSANFSGTASALTHASKFYREDEVYWLSRIINAESRGESLLGQIAVGNVVLNRVKSPLYPNTIWGVIFDKKYGVQFSPVLDGSIYSAPTYTSILAAKICLEGFSLSDDVLFFLYPSASTSSWIPRTREYSFSIGKHDFYS